jgi:hypothetical protein
MYNCNFPGCEYTTDVKCQIHNHHIVPRSKKGSNKNYNLITVCPTHHAKIFIPGELHGQHSKQSVDSIVMIRKLPSTDGEVLEYKYANEEEVHYAKLH